MKRALVFAALALGAAGCASTSPGPGYAAVDAMVASRGGAVTHWDSREPDDPAVDARVRALLGADLTADAAVEVALLRNPHLRATYQSVGVAQAELVQAGLLKNPSLGLHVGLPFTPSTGTELQGTVAEDFLALFTLPLRKRFAAGALDEAELRVGWAVMELDADTRVAFYRLQAAQQDVRLLQLVIEGEASVAELAARQQRAGNISELELATRQAAYEQRRLDLARAELEVADDREALNQRMGTWGESTTWTLSAALAPVPADDAAPEHLESLAIHSRLDLAAARSETERVAQGLALATGTRWVPGLMVGADADHDPEGNTVIGPRLELELPLFDQHQAEVAKLQAQLRQVRARQQALAVDIRAEVRRAGAHLLAARAVAEHYRSTLLPLRQRVVQLAQSHYDGMLLGVYGLIGVKLDEVQSERQYIEAVRDYWVARTELERTLGTRFNPTRTP